MDTEHNIQFTPRNLIVATFASITVGLAVYLIYRNVRNYRAELFDHAELMKQVDPARVTEWQQKVKIEKTVRTLQKEFRELTTGVRCQRIFNPDRRAWEWHNVRVPYPTNSISLADYKEVSMRGGAYWNPAEIREAAEAMGWTVDELFLHIPGPLFTIAGPPPFPNGPSLLWAVQKALLQVGLTAAAGGCVTYTAATERDLDATQLR